MRYPPRLPILLARCRRLYAAGDACCDVVPLFVPSGGSLLTLCLLDVSAVCFDASPVISSLSCLAACRLPLRASARASTPLRRLIISSLVSSHGFSLPAPPHRHAGRGDTTGLLRFSLLCLLTPFGPPSHPCGLALDGDGARRLPH